MESDTARHEGEVAQRLRSAPFEVIGQFSDASNATLLARLRDRDPRPIKALAEELGRAPHLDDLHVADLAVHKPREGERPLWDFPAGTLHLREVAAYEVSDALGWDLVPVTVVRDDGPIGPGSLQRFVPHDPDVHYFGLLEDGDVEVVGQLMQMVVLDLVIDNADRKGGHVLLEEPGDGAPGGGAGAASASAKDGAPGGAPALSGRIRLIDHGVSFNTEPKLRTVAWDFAGEPVPPGLRADVARLCDALGAGLGERLATLLSPAELDTLRTRIDTVSRLERFPEPTGHYPYPWPLL